MGKNVFANSKMSEEELQSLFVKVKEDMGIQNEDLDNIFQVMMLDRKTLFPEQNKQSEEECLRKWINGYIQSENNLPSSHIGEPKKTCSDPALAKIVKNACGLDNNEIVVMEKAHNLFMSAENIQGELLEEYIAENVKNFGWLWCSGNSIRAVDFCKRDGSALLQIKNKNNTENSSSSAIRNGTKIEKWYRLKTRKKNGIPYPSYEWDKLNDIINKGIENGEVVCKMSEEGYAKFLDRVATENPGIITEI